MLPPLERLRHKLEVIDDGQVLGTGTLAGPAAAALAGGAVVARPAAVDHGPAWKNRGLDVVPQLFTKNADEFVWAAGMLADMGYREVNLNVGCSSGVVVAKGKGLGFLRDLEGLEAFPCDVCSRSPISVSVKMGVGVTSDVE